MTMTPLERFVGFVFAAVCLFVLIGWLRDWRKP